MMELKINCKSTPEDELRFNYYESNKKKKVSISVNKSTIIVHEEDVIKIMEYLGGVLNERS